MSSRKRARLADESIPEQGAREPIVRAMEATLAEREDGISKASRTAQTARVTLHSQRLAQNPARFSGLRPCSGRGRRVSFLIPHGQEETCQCASTTDQRIDALLTLLAENSTIVISGATIAKEIGVTRQQVWRWIEKLRELGVKVKGHPHTGYHIERVPDILAPQMLSHRLYGTPFARRIHHFFKIDSTNTVAMRMAEQGEPHGALVLAEEQTGGKRAGRTVVGIGKVRGNLLHDSAEADDSARARAVADAGCGPRRARRRRGRTR